MSQAEMKTTKLLCGCETMCSDIAHNRTHHPEFGASNEAEMRNERELDLALAGRGETAPRMAKASLAPGHFCYDYNYTRLCAVVSVRKTRALVVVQMRARDKKTGKHFLQLRWRPLRDLSGPVTVLATASTMAARAMLEVGGVSTGRTFVVGPLQRSRTKTAIRRLARAGEAS